MCARPQPAVAAAARPSCVVALLRAFSAASRGRGGPRFINNDHLRLFTAKYVDPGESQAVPKSMDDAEAGPSAGEAVAAETQ